MDENSNSILVELTLDKTVGFFLPHRSRRVFSIFKFSKLFPFSDFFEASSRKKRNQALTVLYQRTMPDSEALITLCLQDPWCAGV